MIAQVILAAGLSSRMGQSKPLLDFFGTPLLGRMIDVARRSRVDATYVVLGHDAERVRASVDLDGVTVVVNARYRLGQTTSLQCAIESLPDTARALVNLPVDYPGITSREIDALVDAYADRSTGGPTLFTVTHGGRRGRPTLFDRVHFSGILALGAREPTRSLLATGACAVAEIEVDNPSILDDIDTPEEYTRMLERLADTERR